MPRLQPDRLPDTREGGVMKRTVFTALPRILMATLALNFFMVTAAKAIDVVVGYVEYLGLDAKSRYWLEEDDSRRAIRLLEEIRAKGTIVLEGEQAELVLRMADDSAITLTEKSSPYSVPAFAKPATFGRRARRWLLDIIRRGGEQIRHQGVELSLRSGGKQIEGPLSVPRLWASGQKLYEGERSLAIEWRGGREPFTVMISPSPNLDPLTVSAVVWESTGNSLRGPIYNLAAPSTMFSVGTYTMVIIDADGQWFRGGFEVIPGPDPDQEEPNRAWGELHDFLIAAELAHERIDLTLEVYQQMQQFPPNFQPATAWSKMTLSYQGVDSIDP